MICGRLLQVIAEHLFHEGLFDIGRLFVREAGVAGGEALQRPYASMHTVLQEVSGCARPFEGGGLRGVVGGVSLEGGGWRGGGDGRG